MKKYLAELIGTFVLVLIGCGSAVIAGTHVGFLGIAFAFGLSVLTMCYTIGPISGCHINPAITIGMLAAGRISFKDAVGYWVGQFAGALIAAFVLLWIAKGLPGYDIAVNGLGQNGYGAHSPSGYNLTSALISEIVMSCIFVLVVMGSTSNIAPKGFYGVAIGLSLTMIHIVNIPIDGTSVNPARSFGPAIIVGGEALSQLWLFIVAPLVGGVLAAAIWTGVLKREEGV